MASKIPLLTCDVTALVSGRTPDACSAIDGVSLAAAVTTTAESAMHPLRRASLMALLSGLGVVAGCSSAPRPLPWEAAPDANADAAAASEVSPTADVTPAVDRVTVEDAARDAATMDVTRGDDVLPMDASLGDDALSMDASDVVDALDAAVPDARDAGSVETDLPRANPCAEPAVIDLAAVGTTTGATTRLLADNLLAPARSVLPVPAGCSASDDHPVVYRYTTRTASRLRISASPRSYPFDPAIWLLDRCAATATALGCDDEGRTAASSGSEQVRVTTSAPLAAGAIAYVVVAGYAGRQGRFELVVEEIVAVPAGGACPLDDGLDRCAAGTSCFSADGVGRCVSDGAAGGVCRRAAGDAPCDAGLVCQPVGRGADRCVRILEPGETCNRALLTSVCASETDCRGAPSRCATDGAAGSRCRVGTTGPACDADLVCDARGDCNAIAPVGGACEAIRGLCAPGAVCVSLGFTSRCMIPGSADAPCRVGTTPCDAGLFCTIGGRCLIPIAAGGPCDRSGLGAACATGTSCVNTAFSSPNVDRCVSDGSLRGACRVGAGVAACDAGLACDGWSCLTPIALGGACPVSWSACPEGAACLFNRCLALGTQNGPCRPEPASPRCDPGLACAYVGCIPPTPLGAACNPGSNAYVCASGGSCEMSGGSSRCVAAGAVDGRCRPGATPCDPGLECGAGGNCRAPVAAGGACDQEGRYARCVAGTSCQAGRCVTLGTPGARCRADGGCDGDTVCSGANLCLGAVPVGAACDPYGRLDACAPGSTCQLQEPLRMGSPGRCIAQGASGGGCRVPGAACDPGLTCYSAAAINPSLYAPPSPLCRPAVADGAACDPTGRRDACVAPSRCVTAGPDSWCRPSTYAEVALPTVTLLDACAGDGIRARLSPTGTGLTYTDAAVAVPFPLHLFGVSHSRLWAFTDGGLVFDRAALPPTSLPNLNSGAAVRTGGVYVGGNPGPSLICVRTLGDAPDRRLVIEWLGVTAPEAPLVGLFEVVLSERTDTVDLLYAPLGAPRTVILRDARASVGLQRDRGADFAVHHGGVVAGTGLRFAPR